jgi:hypothetical protein
MQGPDFNPEHHNRKNMKGVKNPLARQSGSFLAIQEVKIGWIHIPGQSRRTLRNISTNKKLDMVCTHLAAMWETQIRGS